LLLILVNLLFVLLILFIGLFGWFASSSRRVRESRPQPPLRVLSVTEETVTLPRLLKTASGGISGIAWHSGFAVIGEITDTSSRTVTRRVVKATEGLSVSLLVRWNKFVYRGDPQSALGLAYEEVHIPSRLRELSAWLVPEERTTWVLVMTYRNDAGAPKSPDHLYRQGDTEWEDVEAGVSYALSHDARDIVLFGWSLGGCIARRMWRTCGLSCSTHPSSTCKGFWRRRYRVCICHTG
jgi:hypothetical protein